MTTRQLIVLGGGGFLMEKSRALDRYFLDATGKANPRVCFVGTASGDADPRATSSTRRWRRSTAAPRTCRSSSRRRPTSRVRAGAGRHLRRRRQHALAARAVARMGSRRRAARAYERGAVLGGISAGMICWFECGITDSVPGALSPLRCLGWLWHRVPALRRRSGAATGVAPAARRRRGPRGYAADDGAALHFVDEALAHCVVSRPNARAYRPALEGGRVTETELPCRLLG